MTSSPRPGRKIRSPSRCAPEAAWCSHPRRDRPMMRSNSCAAMSAGAVVRVGVTQCHGWRRRGPPVAAHRRAGRSLQEHPQGTAMFAKVYRIVRKQYGVENDNGFEDAIIAWRTGTFEDVAVFAAPDPGPAASVPPRGDEGARLANPPVDRPGCASICRQLAG